jgi:hypothetical protein
MRLTTLALALGLAVAGSVHAASIPASGHLDFDVIRKGKDIGDHSYRFSGSQKALTVKVKTDVAVKVPLVQITAYSFTHDSTEKWANGKLVKVSSKTNDDGTPHQLNTDGKGNLPASLWDVDAMHDGTLLNTIDGSLMPVHVADLDEETVPVKGGKIKAHHYRMSKGLNRDLWFDADGNLARVVFKADDGSTITYVRK